MAKWHTDRLDLTAGRSGRPPSCLQAARVRPLAHGQREERRHVVATGNGRLDKPPARVRWGDASPLGLPNWFIVIG